MSNSNSLSVVLLPLLQRMDRNRYIANIQELLKMQRYMQKKDKGRKLASF